MKSENHKDSTGKRCNIFSLSNRTFFAMYVLFQISPILLKIWFQYLSLSLFCINLTSYRALLLEQYFVLPFAISTPFKQSQTLHHNRNCSNSTSQTSSHYEKYPTCVSTRKKLNTCAHQANSTANKLRNST